jgi:16S rRNA (adenine1518-N6/adenine1519-N6)-dimethyltransferase
VTLVPRLRPRKSLGQNFLRDDNIARKIVRTFRPAREDVVLEIGPGEGALTRHLAGAVGTLVVVDIDERVVQRMQSLYPGGEVEILHEDFLATDLAALAERSRRPLRILGNIPYNITSPILFHVLDHRSHVVDLTIMVQKEVARRMAARPGTKDYGILSVFCAMFAETRLLFDVSPNAFFPKPKVTSSVLRLTFLPSPRETLADERFFRTMVRGVFGKRRKTLRNSLAYVLQGEIPERPAGVNLGRRPEELTPEELAMVSNSLWEENQRHE